MNTMNEYSPLYVKPRYLYGSLARKEPQSARMALGFLSPIYTNRKILLYYS